MNRPQMSCEARPLCGHSPQARNPAGFLLRFAKKNAHTIWCQIVWARASLGTGLRPETPKEACFLGPGPKVRDRAREGTANERKGARPLTRPRAPPPLGGGARGRVRGRATVTRRKAKLFSSLRRSESEPKARPRLKLLATSGLAFGEGKPRGASSSRRKLPLWRDGW